MPMIIFIKLCSDDNGIINAIITCGLLITAQSLNCIKVSVPFPLSSTWPCRHASNSASHCHANKATRACVNNQKDVKQVDVEGEGGAGGGDRCQQLALPGRNSKISGTKNFLFSRVSNIPSHRSVWFEASVLLGWLVACLSVCLPARYTSSCRPPPLVKIVKHKMHYNT